MQEVETLEIMQAVVKDLFNRRGNRQIDLKLLNHIIERTLEAKMEYIENKELDDIILENRYNIY